MNHRVCSPDADLHVDPDIRCAWTLPASVYTDPAIFERARQRIFARSWQFIADRDAARLPPQIHPALFLEGMLEEPLLLTRDRDDVLHCVSNVCTHRGALVAEQPAQAAHLRCRYHGRRFSLDGTFQSMPEFEQAANFPSPCDHLKQFPIGELGPLIFAALEPSFSFADWISDITRRLGWLQLHEFKLDPARSRDYLVQANWMLYCENYLEGFHIPFVHADLNTALDYGSYATELFDFSNLQIGIAASGGEHTFNLPADSPDHGKPIAGYYYWLFPNCMLNFYPWGLSMNIVKPLAVNRTKITYRTYIWDAAKLDQGAGAVANLDRVEREDEAIVEAVQRGMQSRTYQRGRFSPTREQGVHHFQRLIAEFLSPSR